MIVNGALATKPIPEKRSAVAAAVVGAYVVPELVAPSPVVRVTFGVMTNEAIAEFPFTSVTVTV